MAVEKLRFVNISGPESLFDRVALDCLRCACFHPKRSIGNTDNSGLPESVPYSRMLEKIASAAGDMNLSLRYMPKLFDDCKGNWSEILENEYDGFIQRFDREYRQSQSRFDEIDAEIVAAKDLAAQMRRISSIKINFDEIFSLKYVKSSFGYLPDDSLERLPYYSDKMFIFVPLDHSEDFCFGICLTVIGYTAETDALLDRLMFRSVSIPDAVRGTPETSLSALENLISELSDERDRISDKLSAFLERERDTVNRIYTFLKFFQDSSTVRKCASAEKTRGELFFSLSGFVPDSKSDTFVRELSKRGDISVKIGEPRLNVQDSPPTALKNRWFCKPFEMFVEMYGLPQYGDIDPTPFFAITYSLLFGIMFGDLGQGLLLSLVGALLWKFKKMRLGRIINRIGISSAFFGLLYGSIFGLEDVLTPFYVNILGMSGKPLDVLAPENTNFILIGAAALGVLLICISIVIDIVVSARKRDWERAFFSANGVAGLVFYFAAIFGGVMTFFGKKLFTPIYVFSLIICPLLIMLLREPLGLAIRNSAAKRPLKSKSREKINLAEFLTDGFFELFDIVLAFFSNTMSFIRVGGFVLSHAGMMAVVLTLSKMVGQTASPIVMVAGNIFVICIEGLIVGIQVLRLEFYEMFSRFYDGGGIPFAPALNSSDNSEL